MSNDLTSVQHTGASAQRLVLAIANQRLAAAGRKPDLRHTTAKPFFDENPHLVYLELRRETQAIGHAILTRMATSVSTRSGSVLDYELLVENPAERDWAWQQILTASVQLGHETVEISSAAAFSAADTRRLERLGFRDAREVSFAMDLQAESAARCAPRRSREDEITIMVADESHHQDVEMLLGKVIAEIGPKQDAKGSVADRLLAMRQQLPPNNRFLWAKLGERAVGLLNLWEFHTVFGSKIATLSDVYVARDYRRSNIGCLLVAEAVRLAQIGNASQMGWIASENNEAALGFWRGFGSETARICFRRSQSQARITADEATFEMGISSK